MTKEELIERKIKFEQQWLYLLTETPLDEDLGLPSWMSRQYAIDESLDRINNLKNLLKSLKDEK